MQYSLSKIFFVLMLCAFFPISVDASELRLDLSKVGIRTGEEFTVLVIMSADEMVNAVEGRIVFSDTIFEIREICDGNSSVNFWIEKPRLESPGILVFSGITPGGFSGVNNQLFSIVFEAKQEGTASISITQAKVLKNDGTGTEISLALRNATVNIKTGNSGVRKEIIEDTVVPEPFMPAVVRDPSVFDGKWFIAFSTQDKDSGISHYEIREYRFKPLSFLSLWRTVESPYVLSDQKLKSYISIRAVDNADNMQVSEIAPTHPLLWYEYALYWVIIISVFCGVGYAFSKIWRKNI